MRRRKAGLGPSPTPAAAQSVTVTTVPQDAPDEDAFDEAKEPLPALKTSGFQQFGSVMGGVIAGIEQQVFGRKPPGEVQVRQAQPTRGHTGDGTQVTLDFPEPGHGETTDAEDPTR
ncbi:MAG: hypothetical protein U0667_07710 [Chloroflexota bacterium]